MTLLRLGPMAAAACVLTSVIAGLGPVEAAQRPRLPQGFHPLGPAVVTTLPSGRVAVAPLGWRRARVVGLQSDSPPIGWSRAPRSLHIVLAGDRPAVPPVIGGTPRATPRTAAPRVIVVER